MRVPFNVDFRHSPADVIDQYLGSLAAIGMLAMRRLAPAPGPAADLIDPDLM